MPKPKPKTKQFSIVWRTKLPAAPPNVKCEALHCTKSPIFHIELGMLSFTLCEWHDIILRLNARTQHDAVEIINLTDMGDTR